MRHSAVLATVLGCAPLMICAQAFAVPLVGVSFSGTGGATLYTISPQSGLAASPRSLGLDRIVGTAATPDGTLYALTSHSAATNPSSLFTINPADGSATLIGSTGLSNIAEGDLAIDPITGTIYGGYCALNGHRRLFTIDPTTGQASLLPADIYGDASGLAFDSAGNLFALDSALGKLYGVNKQTGAAISTVTLSGMIGGTAGMTIDPGTGTFYVADGGTGGTNLLYTLNSGTGALTPIGATGVSQGISGLAFLPEPTTFILCSAWAVWTLARRRHYR